MKRTSLFCITLIALIAVIVGCAPAQTTKPVAADEKPPHIMIVYNSDVSGPYAAIAGPALLGWGDAVDYINNELGGLYGVPFKYTMMDTKAKVDACVGNMPKILDMKPRPLGMSVSHAAECEALLPLTREAQLTTMTSQTLGSLYPVGYQFSVYALYPDIFGYFIDWVLKDWKGTGKPKVALCDWDNATGRGFYTDEAAAYAKEKGVDIVARELFPATAVDVTTQLTRIQNAKADYIFSGTLVNGSYAVATTAYKMGMKIPIVFPMNTSYDLPLIKMNTAAAEGTYFVGGGWPLTDYSNPGVKIARGYWDKAKRPDKDWCSAIINNGWAVVMKFYEASKQVVDKHGWKNLDGKHLKETMETWDNKSIFHGIQVVTYTPSKHSQTLGFMGQVKGGNMISTESGWQPFPDLRPAEYKK
jgi:branched-chain amino acid transport system substrate-binding protein